MEATAHEMVTAESDSIGDVAVETDELILPDADWDDFVAEMESVSIDGDGISEVESRIDWLLQNMRDLTALVAQNDAVASNRIAMIRDFQQGENAKLERQIEWLTGQIGTLAPSSGEEMSDTYKAKSRTLPFGKFGFRTRPDSIEIEDMDKAVAFARTQNLPVKTVLTVSKTELKKYAKATGDIEAPAAWRLVQGDDEFFATPAE